MNVKGGEGSSQVVPGSGVRVDSQTVHTTSCTVHKPSCTNLDATSEGSTDSIVYKSVTFSEKKGNKFLLIALQNEAFKQSLSDFMQLDIVQQLKKKYKIESKYIKKAYNISLDEVRPIFDKATQLLNTARQLTYEYNLNYKIKRNEVFLTVKSDLLQSKPFTIELDTIEKTTRVAQTVHVILLSEYILQHVFVPAPVKTTEVTFVPQMSEEPLTMNPEDRLVQNQVLEVSSNTSITHDTNVSQAITTEDDFDLQLAATTEPKRTFAQLTERYISVLSGELSTGDVTNQRIFDIDIPGTIYENLDSTTATALRPFSLIKTGVKIMVKVNSNQAQCGYYVLAFYPCREQAIAAPDSVYMAIQREHADLIVSTSNDLEFDIPYENLRPFMPINVNEIGDVTGQSFGRLTLWCLSPLRIADSGNPRVPYQVFARFVDPFLTAMRHPIPVQEVTRFVPQALEPIVDSEPKRKLLGVLKDVNSVVQQIPVFGKLWKLMGSIGASAATSIARIATNEEFVKNFENNLVYVGLKNRDKPADIAPPVMFMPVPQKALAHGIGAIPTMKMRLENTSNTPHLSAHTTSQTLDSLSMLAQIPGIQLIFELSNGQNQGDILAELPAAPVDARYRPPAAGGISANSVYYPPVAYFLQTMQGYSGQIEYEITPIKTASHNFSILVAFVPFDGEPGSTTYSQALSCAYKVIDFRTTDTGVFTVPYISTQMFRQYPYTNSGSRLPLPSATIDSQWKDPGKVVIYLVNPLNPTPIVSSSIQVLVKMKAAKNFQYVQPRTPVCARGSDLHTLQVAAGFTLTSTPPVPQGSNDDSLNTGPAQMASETEIEGNVGRPIIGPQIQYMELHDNIDNICRRSYFYVPGRTTYFRNSTGYVPGLQNAFSYPITPIWPAFRRTPGSGAASGDQSTGIFIGSYFGNPRDWIGSAFRWYRGGFQFTILNQSSQNLCIEYKPPMTRPYSINGYTAGNTDTLLAYEIAAPFTHPITVGPPSVGTAAVLNIPSVNPVSEIEIPFYGCNNYIDLQARFQFSSSQTPVSTVTGPFYDIISRTNGQLEIKNLDTAYTIEQAEEQSAKLQIFMALADDGRFYHFMGCPPAITTVLTNPPLSTRSLTRQEIETQLLREGVEANPGPVVSSFRPQSTNSNTEERYEPQGLYDSVKNIVSFPKDLLRNIRELNTTSSYFKDTVETIKMKMALFMDVDYTLVTIFVTSLVSAFQNPTKLQIVTTSLIFLKVLGLFTDESILKVTTAIMSRISPQDRNDEFIGPIVASCILEAICQVGNIKKQFVNETPIIEKFANIFVGINWVRVGAVSLVLSRLVHAIKWMFSAIHKWFLPAKDYKMLQTSPMFIANFVKEYEFFYQTLNETSHAHIQKHRMRWWTMLFSAYYLNNIIAKNNIVNHPLKAMVTSVIKKGNELTKTMTSPPVRYEPFSIWFEGKPGVGKSTIGQHLIKQCLKSQGLETPDPIYIRMATSPWWNGYNGQYAVWLDDVGAVGDQVNEPQLVAEFIALKSCAPMGLEMPRLDQKDMVMTSIIVGAASNFLFWPVDSVRNKEALDRRRDVTVNVSFSEQAESYFQEHNIEKQVASALPAEMLQNYSHLKFGVYETTPIRRQTGTTSLIKTNMSYEEFKEYLITKHNEYHHKELSNMTKRYKESLELVPSLAAEISDDATTKAALMRMMLQVDCQSDVPTETLKRLIYTLENKLPAVYKDLPDHVQQNIQIMRETAQPQSKIDLDLTGINYDNLSTWMKEQLPILRPTTASGFFQEIKEKFKEITRSLANKIAPWTVELSREVEITSECAVCREHKEDWQFICAASTETSQHVVCVECSRNPVMPTRCPICRSYDLIRRKPNRWTTYTKIAYFLKMAKNFLKLCVNSIVDSALIIYLCTIATVLIYSLKVIYEEQCNIETLQDSTYQFVKETGEMPDQVDLLNGNVIYKWIGSYWEFDGDKLQMITPNLPQGKDNSLQRGINLTENSTVDKPTTSDNRSYLYLFPKTTRTNVKECNHVLDIDESYELDYATVVEGDDPNKEENIKNVITAMKNGKIYTFYDAQCESNCKYDLEYQERIRELVLQQNVELWINIRNGKYPGLVPPWFVIDQTNRPAVDGKVSFWCKVQKIIYETIQKCFLGPLHRIYTFLKEYARTIICSLTVLIAVIYGYTWYYSVEEDTYIVELEPQSSVNNQSQVQPRKATTRQLNSGIGQRPQGLVEEEIPLVVLSRAAQVKRNTWHAIAGKIDFYITGVKDHIALIPRHTYQRIKAEHKPDMLVSVTNYDGIQHVFKFKEFIAYDRPDYEYVIVEVPRQLSFKNIEKSMLRAYDDNGEETNPVVPSVLYAVDVLNDCQVKIVDGISVQKPDPLKAKYRLINGKVFDYENNQIREWFQTSLTNSGQCGTIYMDSKGTIYGYHVAGWEMAGAAVPLYQEALQLEAKPQGFEGLKYLHDVDDPPYHVNKSKLIPTPMAPFLYESIQEPCIQSKFDPRYMFDADPLTDGCQSLGTPTKPADNPLVKASLQAVFEELVKSMPPPYTSTPVSFEEAVTASKSVNVSSMDLSTSAGYPLCRKDKMTGLSKGHYIQICKTTGKVKADESLVKYLEYNFQARSKGIQPPTIYWAHLKDELRKKSKARAFSGTRVFSVAPLELVVNSRRVMMVFMESFQAKPIAHHHAVGLSPDSKDWTKLQQNLRSKGSKLIQMDFKKFSDTLPHEFVSAAFTVISLWYNHYNLLTQETFNLIKTISHDIMRAKVLIHNKVYELKNGVLQGHPLTAVINSLVNLIMQAYMWNRLTLYRPIEFFSSCYIIVMGDDVVISVPQQHANEYNCSRLVLQFKDELGIEATDGDKNKVTKDFDEYEHFEFLSRTQVKHPFRKGIYLAPPKMTSLFDCPLWMRTTTDVVEQSKEAIQASLLLAYGHGPIFFERFKRLLLTANNVPPHPYFTWYEIDRLFFGELMSDEIITPKKKKALLHDRVVEKQPRVSQSLDTVTVSLNRSNSTREVEKKKPQASQVMQAELDRSDLPYDEFLEMSDFSGRTCKCRYNCMQELEKREEEAERRRKPIYVEPNYAVTFQGGKSDEIGTSTSAQQNDRHMSQQLSTVDGVIELDINDHKDKGRMPRTHMSMSDVLLFHRINYKKFFMLKYLEKDLERRAGSKRRRVVLRETEKVLPKAVRLQGTLRGNATLQYAREVAESSSAARYRNGNATSNVIAHT